MEVMIGILYLYEAEKESFNHWWKKNNIISGKTGNCSKKCQCDNWEIQSYAKKKLAKIICFVFPHKQDIAMAAIISPRWKLVFQ